MGMFKEEAYQFETLYENQPNLGYNTGNQNHSGALQEIRNWMTEMKDMRYNVTYFSYIGLEVTDPTLYHKRQDTYFIAWEEDEGMIRGTEYIVLTTKKADGTKTVTLNGRAASYTPKQFRMKK